MTLLMKNSKQALNIYLILLSPEYSLHLVGTKGKIQEEDSSTE